MFLAQDRHILCCVHAHCRLTDTMLELITCWNYGFQNVHPGLQSFGIREWSNFTGDDLQDYTKVWMKQIDRGGLHHVNDTFYNFSVAVEYKCRKYLDTRLTPGYDLVSKIKEDCLKSEHIEKLWKEISIPPC